MAMRDEPPASMSLPMSLPPADNELGRTMSSPRRLHAVLFAPPPPDFPSASDRGRRLLISDFPSDFPSASWLVSIISFGLASPPPPHPPAPWIFPSPFTLLPNPHPLLLSLPPPARLDIVRRSPPSPHHLIACPPAPVPTAMLRRPASAPPKRQHAAQRAVEERQPAQHAAGADRAGPADAAGDHCAGLDSNGPEEPAGWEEWSTVAPAVAAVTAVTGPSIARGGGGGGGVERMRVLPESAPASEAAARAAPPRPASATPLSPPDAARMLGRQLRGQVRGCAASGGAAAAKGPGTCERGSGRCQSTARGAGSSRAGGGAGRWALRASRTRLAGPGPLADLRVRTSGVRGPRQPRIGGGGTAATEWWVWVWCVTAHSNYIFWGRCVTAQLSRL